MRPTDDNQTASTRPPFMSATRRATAGEDSILARLERDSRRGKSGSRWKKSWIAWCALASLAIVGLIGVLASLAQENLEVHRQPVLVEAKVTRPDPYAAPDSTALLIKGGFAPLPALASPPKRPAEVVDVRPERIMVKADEPAEPPPLVMLTKEPAPAAAKPAASAKPAPEPLHKAAPAARIVPPRTVSTTAVARPKKVAPAQGATASVPALDSDVALLSAIIMHANRHAAERAQMEAARCVGKKCAPAGDAASKATD